MDELKEKLAQAAQALEKGEVIGLVTDTVWGLAARIDRPHAIDKIFGLKGRNFNQPLAVLVPDRESAENISSQWPAEAEELAREFWPGGLTIIVRTPRELAAAVHSSTPTVGLRMPDHPVALKLLALTGPLAATSANPSGQRELDSAEQVRTQFGDRLAMVLDGPPSPNGLASTVIDVSRSPISILRQGPLARELKTWRPGWF